MRRAIFVFLISSSAFAQRIFSISPKLGTVGGGDIVTIKIEGMSLACPEVCDIGGSRGIVYFGDTLATSEVSADETSVQVRTPRHAKGTVDVTVQNLRGQSASGAQFTFSGFGGDIERSNYEVVLVPVGVSPNEPPLAGLNGSQWRSSIWVGNSSNQAVEFFAGYPYCALLCASCCMGTTPFPGLSGFQLRDLSPDFVEIHTARLYYLQKGLASSVSFSARVRDVSRSSDTEGTAIPVVREKDLRSGELDLLDVPVDALSRTALRLYDVDVRSDTMVTLRFYSMPENQLVTSYQIGLVPPRTDFERTSFPSFAGYGEVMDISRFLSSGRYRINISSNNFARLWAFASVTNNSTQFVTVIAPN